MSSIMNPALSDQDIEDKLLNAIKSTPAFLRQREAMQLAGLDDKDRDLSNRASKALGRLRHKGLVKNAKPGSPLWCISEPEAPAPVEKPKTGGHLFLDDITIRLAELAPLNSPMRIPATADGFNMGIIQLFGTVGNFNHIPSGMPPVRDGESEIPYIESPAFRGTLAARAGMLIINTMDLCRQFGVAPADLEDAIKMILFPEKLESAGPTTMPPDAFLPPGVELPKPPVDVPPPFSDLPPLSDPTSLDSISC